MVSLKDQLHKIVDEPPDGDAALEEMQRRLLVLQQVNKGISELDRGEGVSHEAVVQRMKPWITK